MPLTLKRRFKVTFEYELELNPDIYEGQEYVDIVEKLEKEIESEVDSIVDVTEKDHPYLWIGQITCTKGKVKEITVDEL